MLKPTDSYSDFFSFFLGSLEPGGDYKDFLAPTEALIVEITKTDFLPSPIQNETDVFLRETLPEIIGRMTRFEGVHWLDPISGFLTKATMLTQWAAVRDRIELFPCLQLIFSEETRLAKSADSWKRTFLPKLKETLISHEYLTIILTRLQDERKPATLAHFSFFFTLYNSVSDKIKPPTAQHLVEMASFAFILFLEHVSTELDKIRPSELTNTFSQAVKACITDECNEISCPILQFAQGLLSRDSPEWKACAVELFKLISGETAHPFAKTAFKHFCEEQHLVDQIFEQELQPQVVVLFESQILERVQAGTAPKDLVQRLWNGVKKGSTDSGVLAFIGEIINLKEIDELKDILREMARDDPQGCMSGVVKQLIKSSKDENRMELLIRFLGRVVQKKGRATEREKQDLIELCQSGFEVQRAAISVFKEFVEKETEPQEFYLDVLKEALRSPPPKLSAFEDRDCAIFIDLFVKTKHRERILDIVDELVSAKLMKLDISLIEHLLTEPVDDLVWSFLARQLQKDVASETGQDVYAMLRSFLESRTVPFSSSFLTFLKDFMISVNITSGKMKSDKGKTTVQSLPLEMEELLFNLLFVNEEKDAALVKQAIIDIYASMASYEEVSMKFYELVKNNLENDVVLRRTLELVRDYCQFVEKDVEKLISRHGKAFVDITGHVKVTVKLPDAPDEQRFIRKDTTVQELLQAMGPHLEESAEHYQVMHGKNVCKDRLASGTSGVTNASCFSIVKADEAPQSSDTIWPTVALGRLQFTKCLFEILDNKHDSSVYSICTDLLALLPTDEEMLKMSISPTFLENTRPKNLRQIQYLLEVILWRIRAPLYKEGYANSTSFGKFVVHCLEAPRLMTLCGETVIEVAQSVDFKNATVQSQVEVALLRILKNTELKRNTKSLGLECLSRSSQPMISELLERDASLLETIESIVGTLDNELWDKFKSFLWKLNNKPVLFKMSLRHLSEPGSDHFKEIFMHFSEDMSEECSPNEQIEHYLDFIENGYFEDSAARIMTILKQNEGKLVNCKELIEKGIHILINVDMPNNVESDVCKFVIALSKSAANNGPLDRFMENMSALQLDRWSVIPSDGCVRGLPGMKNMGATCYMNSVFQCLLRIPLFRKMLIECDPKDDDSLKEIQKLVHFLMFSRRRYCDTTSFCRCWRGWGKQIVDPREQQDANEFLQLFLDQLPTEVNSLVQGELINEIVPENGASVKIPETFFSIGLTVKDMKGVEDSLAAFAADELLVGENQYVMDGQHVDAKKSHRIKTAPMVLVLQLRRFEYDLRTHERIKINSRFEIPDVLSLSQYMENPNTPATYALFGAVLHCGEVGAGHYSSFARVDKEWWKFNDIETSLSDNAAFEREAVGGGEARTAAYLLFYTKIIESTDLDQLDVCGDLPINYSQEMRQIVERDNDAFMHERCAFTNAASQIFLECANLDQLRDFYFRVHCHSRSAELASAFADRLLDLMVGQEVACVKWLRDNFETLVIPVFVSCTVVEIVKGLSKIIHDVWVRVNDAKETVDLIELFVFRLDDCLKSWRQLPHISSIIEDWLKHDETCLAYGRERHWCRTIAEFVGHVFDGTRNKIFLENVDLRPVIGCISLLVSVDDNDSLQKFPDMMAQAEQSRNNGDPFKQLLLKCTDLGIFNVARMSVLMPSKFPVTKIVELELKNLDSDNFKDSIYRMLATKRVTLRLVAEELSKNAESMSPVLLANCSTVVEWLDSTEGPVRLSASKILKELRKEHGPAVLESMLAVLRENKVGEEFLRILTELTGEIQPPRDKPYEGLKDQKSSAALYPLLAYFGERDIVKACESELASQTNNVSIRKKIFGLVPSLQLCCDSEFVELVTSETWRAKQNAVTSALDCEKEQVDALIELMCDKQSLSPVIHELLMELILGKKENEVSRRHIQNTVKWLAKVDSLNSSDFLQVHKLITTMLSARGNDEIRVVLSLIDCALKLLENPDIVKEVGTSLEFDLARIEQFLANEDVKVATAPEKIIHYILKCCSIDGNLLMKLRAKVDARGKIATAARKFTYLWLKLGVSLCLIDSSLTEEQYPEIIRGYHKEAMRFVTKVTSARIFSVYMEVMRSYFDNPPTWIRTTIALLYKDAKLTTDSERELFRKWLPVFDNESIDKLITNVCADVPKWTKKDNSQVLERVQRVVFLIETLPQQKQEIVALISQEVIQSFPKGKEGKDWCEIVKVFSR